MGAVLNAPLAALMALLELTQNSNIIFPAMLAITVANITNTELCRQKSAHQTVLLFLKQKLRTDPLSLSLQRTSVASIMDRKLGATEQHVNREEAKQLLSQPCNWFLVEKDEGELRLLGSQQLHSALSGSLVDHEKDTFDLLDLAQNHRMVVKLHMQATLREAQDLLDEHNADAIYISGFVASSPYPDSGILTRADIRHYTETPQ
jgi:CIC family chloride channel protein